MDNFKKLDEIKKLKEGPDNETAEEALERLGSVIKMVKNSDELDDDMKEYIESYKFCEGDKVTEEDIKKEEERNDIVLPKKYKEFLLKYGKFGFTDSEQRAPIFPLMSMTDILSDWFGREDKKELEQYLLKVAGEKALTRLENLYAFAYGDRQLQLEWNHYFDYNCIDPETGEPGIRFFDQEDIEDLAADYQGASFDAFMSWAVDEQIELIVNEFE